MFKREEKPASPYGVITIRFLTCVQVTPCLLATDGTEPINRFAYTFEFPGGESNPDSTHMLLLLTVQNPSMLSPFPTWCPRRGHSSPFRVIDLAPPALRATSFDRNSSTST